MSWETFKQNILRVATNPESIQDLKTVADLYANEYDAAIKRGFDTIHHTKVRVGDVETMKTFFLSALQKGLTSSEPYDLVGQMGEGVKAYWATAVLGNEVVPVQPAPGSISNIAVTDNRCTFNGVWQKPIVNPQLNFELTPEKRIQYQERLDAVTQKYNKAIAEDKKIEASTYEDEMNKIESILTENEEYRITIPTDKDIKKDSNNKLSLTDATVTTGTVNTQTTNTTVYTQNGDSFEEENVEEEGGEVKFNKGKPFNIGAKAGVGTITSDGSFSYFGPPVPAPTYPPNASVGLKAVLNAQNDLKYGVKEIPRGSDSGHARILEMQKNGAGGGTGFAWCACAVTTWWTEAGVTISGHPNKAYVPTWWDWAEQNGRLVDKRNGANPDFVPKPGDAIIYGWGGMQHRGFDHIGIVEKVENGVVFGIDGNYDEAVTRHIATTKSIRGFIII